MYQFEMTVEDHRKLIEVLKGIEGKAILSGYPNRLYEKELADWRTHDIDMPNHAAGGKSKRRMTERLWMNYDA
jgi:DNA adenine methylase